MTKSVTPDSLQKATIIVGSRWHDIPCLRKEKYELIELVAAEFDDYQNQIEKLRHPIVTKYLDRIAALESKLVEIKKYAAPHHDTMWAASVLSVILECDFRDCKRVLDSEKTADDRLGDG